MGTTSARAALLGVGGTGGMTILAGALVRSAVLQWPGWAVSEPASALAFLTTVGAAALAGWAALIIGSATTYLVRTRHQLPSPQLGRDVASRSTCQASPIVRRVAAGLLVLAGTATGPAMAQPAAAPTQVSTQVAPGAGTDQQGGYPAADHPGALPPSPALTGDTSTGRSAVTLSATTGRPVGDGVPQPGWTPTPPTPGQGSAPTLPPGDIAMVSTAPTDQEARSVVVTRGDTLWAIAARHLGPQATDQDVAAHWPRWYAANRAVIGDDPDLILPGQVLTAPTHEES